MIRSSPTHILFCRISSVAPRAVFGTFLMSNSLSDTGLAVLWDIIGGLLVTCSEYRNLHVGKVLFVSAAGDSLVCLSASFWTTLFVVKTVSD